MTQAIPPETMKAVEFNKNIPHEVLNGNQALRLNNVLRNKQASPGLLDKAQLQLSTSNIFTRMANSYFDTEEKNPTDFSNWVEAMIDSVNYTGMWDRENTSPFVKRIQENLALKEEPWGAFVAGLTTKRILGNGDNAIRNFLTPEIIKSDPLVIPALTAIRDELITLETGPLRTNKSSSVIEKGVALQGVLMPGAWQHLYDQSTQFMINQGADFPLKKALPGVEDIHRKVIVQEALNALSQADVLPKVNPEPATPDGIIKGTNDLINVQIGFQEGIRYSIRKSAGKNISDILFADLFHRRVGDGGGFPQLVVDDDARVVHTEEGKTAFLVGALMKALIVPPDSSNFSATEITSLFMDGEKNKALALSLFDKVGATMERIFENSNEDTNYKRVSEAIALSRKLLQDNT